MIYDITLERFILGTFLSEKDAFIEHAHLLSSDLWYQDGHRVIYEAIKELSNKNAPIDIVSGTMLIKKQGQLDYIGGAHYMTELTSDIFLAGGLEYHIRILTQLYIKRTLIAFGAQITQRASDITSDVFEDIEHIESKLFDINSHIIGNDSEDENSVKETFTYLTTPREERFTGIKTGNPYLTEIIGGFNPGNLIYLCARPSMGKTTRALQFGIEAALSGKKVAIFSLEMVKKHEVNTKLINYISEVSSDIIQSQSYNSEELEKIKGAADYIDTLPIYINDKSGINPNYIRSVCRQRQRKQWVDMIIIDYLQMMTWNEKTKKSTNDEVGLISRALKAIAKDLKVPVICLSQLSRQCEERPNKRPQMRDLRDSGNLEQDADIILSLYRPAYYDSEPTKEYIDFSPHKYDQVCELGILKNRTGSANGRIFEYFDRPIGKFNHKYEINEHTNF